MDEQRSPLKSELKFLERLSIEELEALLKLSGDPNDVELLFDTVVEEVVAREREKPTGRLPDVDAAWDELQARYQTMPDTGSHPQFQEQSTDSTAAGAAYPSAGQAQAGFFVEGRPLGGSHGLRGCFLLGTDGWSPGGGG